MLALISLADGAAITLPRFREPQFLVIPRTSTRHQISTLVHFINFAFPLPSIAWGAPVNRQAGRLLTMFAAAPPRLQPTAGRMLIAAALISILFPFLSSSLTPLASSTI